MESIHLKKKKTTISQFFYSIMNMNMELLTLTKNSCVQQGDSPMLTTTERQYLSYSHC